MERKAEMNAEHVPQSESFDYKKHVEWQLQLIGLTPENLARKTILDVGAGGTRYLEKYVRAQKIPSTVVSLDLWIDPLGGETPGTAVVVDAFDGLPFKDNSFDLLINDGGPLSGSPFDEHGMHNYRDAMRVLKPGGELRVTNPYMDVFRQKGGIPTLLQQMALGGQLSVDLEEVAYHAEGELKYAKAFGYEGDRETLLQGILYNGLPMSNVFWVDYMEENLSKDIQEGLHREFTIGLQQKLVDSHIPARTGLYDPTPGAENFRPTLVIKKG